MKKLLLFAAVATVTFLQGCGNSSSASAQHDSTGQAGSDSSATVQANAPASPAPALNKQSTEFAIKAAKGGMAEVALGKIAAKKAMSKDVRDFAAMMVDDHTKANKELMQIAASENITLPSGITDDDQKMINNLSMKSGKDFDKSYMDMMLGDHQKTIDLFKSESMDSTDTTLKNFAASTLPTLQKHLAKAESITGTK